MIGIAEIVFSIIMFILTWFTIFKFVLIYQNRKLLKNIDKKLDQQGKKIICGKEVILGNTEEIDKINKKFEKIKEQSRATDKKKSDKKRRFSFFGRKKRKEVKEKCLAQEVLSLE